MKPSFKTSLLLLVVLLTCMLASLYVTSNDDNNPIITAYEQFGTNIRYQTKPNVSTSTDGSAVTRRGLTFQSLPALIKDSITVRTTAAGKTWIQCKKKTNVVFLKVHKAGSTTVMNIYLRLAARHGLNVVLPKSSSGFGFNYLGYGKTVTRESIVPLPSNETYNILCNHVVYNKPAFRSIMPNDTTYVAILREPTSQFVSAATYYGFFKHLETLVHERNSTNISSITQFLRDPTSFNVGTYFVYNRMSFDFGIPQAQFQNDSFVDSYIKGLGQDYSLVMLMDHFYESLVLMRRELCWETRDILYVPLNERHSGPKISLSSEDKERLRKWNKADYKLYDHFKRVFDAKLKTHGQDLLDEVESLKHIQTLVKTFCDSVKNDIFVVPETLWGGSFLVDIKDCRLMMEPELSTMKRLIEAAWARYNRSVAIKS